MANGQTGSRTLLAPDTTTIPRAKPGATIEKPYVAPNILALLALLKSELTCRICDSPLRRPESLPCGHSFCAACIRRVLLLPAQCPEAYCTVAASAKDLRPVRALEACVDHLSRPVTSPKSSRNSKSAPFIAAVLRLKMLRRKKRHRQPVLRGKENRTCPAPPRNGIHAAQQVSTDRDFTAHPGRNRGRKLSNSVCDCLSPRPPEDTTANAVDFDKPAINPFVTPVDNPMEMLANVAVTEAGGQKAHGLATSMKPAQTICKTEKHRKAVAKSRQKVHDGYERLRDAMTKAKPDLKRKPNADLVDESTDFILFSSAPGHGDGQEDSSGMKSKNPSTRMKLNTLTEEERKLRRNGNAERSRLKLHDALERLQTALLKVNPKLTLRHKKDVVEQAARHVLKAQARANPSCGRPGDDQDFNSLHSHE